MIKQLVKKAAKKTPVYWAYSKAQKRIHRWKKERQRKTQQRQAELQAVKQAIQRAEAAPHVVIKQDGALDERVKFYQMSFFAEFTQYFGAKTSKIIDDQYGAGRLIYNIDFSFFPLNECYAGGFDAYFKKIKCAERALIRKAQKNGFVCKEICYDEHLDEVFAINTSKAERQGEKMSESYTTYPIKREALVKSVGQTIKSFGCFNKDGVLVAYAMYERYGTVFHTVKFLGHKGALTFGVMNYLLAFAVQSLSGQYPACTILYGGGGQMVSRDSRKMPA